MLCHLCGFGVVSVGLIYDFISRITDSFTPLDIELLVSVLTRMRLCRSSFKWNIDSYFNRHQTVDHCCDVRIQQLSRR